MEAYDAVITGIVSICHSLALVLFGPESTFFYVPAHFDFDIESTCKSLAILIRVSTPMDDFVVVYWVYRSY